MKLIYTYLTPFPITSRISQLSSLCTPPHPTPPRPSSTPLPCMASFLDAFLIFSIILSNLFLHYSTQNNNNIIQLMETTLMAATTQKIIRDIERLQSKEQEASRRVITWGSYNQQEIEIEGERYNYNGDDWRWAYSEAKVKLDSLQDEISSEIKSFLPQLLGKLQPVTAQNCPLLHPVKTQLESFSQTTAGNNHGQFREILKQLPRDWHVQLADCI